MTKDNDYNAKEPTRVILALDVGSSSVRCTAYQLVDDDDDSRRTSSLRSLYGCSSSRSFASVNSNHTSSAASGHIHHLKGLLDGIDMVVDDELKRLEAFSPDEFHQHVVVGLGFASFSMNLVGINGEGDVVGSTASFSYACNSTHVNQEVQLLSEQMSPARWNDMYQRTGAPLHAAYALPQLRAFYRHHLQVAKHVHKWQTVASLCLSRWTGRDWGPISYSEASWTGMLNFTTCEWDEEALALLPEACRDALPTLRDCTNDDVWEGGIPEYPECLTEELEEGQSSSVASVKVNPYWNRWPPLRGSSDGGGCRLFLGIGDGACANIGSKCWTPSRIAVTVGTSAAARVVIPLEPHVETLHVPSGLFCYRLDKAHVVLGGALTDGGSVMEWCRSLFGLESEEKFEDCMEQVKNLMEKQYQKAESMGSRDEGVVMVPFLSGERSTGFRTGATASLVGLTRDTNTPAHMVLAAMESVTLRLNAIVQLIKQTLLDTHYHTIPPRIVASGNALQHNLLWRQMIADCTGMEVEMEQDITEATSLGVARMVSIALAMKEHDESSSSSKLWLQEEQPLSSPAKCHPHAVATYVYWRHAGKAQEDAIAALSPTW